MFCFVDVMKYSLPSLQCISWTSLFFFLHIDVIASKIKQAVLKKIIYSSIQVPFLNAVCIKEEQCHCRCVGMLEMHE